MAEIDIKKEYKSPAGIYILFGEEDYLKRFYAAEIRAAVVGDSPYAPFNHLLFSQKDFSVDAAIDAVSTPPIGEDKKLIELCEFQLGNLKAEELNALLDFLTVAAEQEDAVVLMNLADGALEYKSNGKFDPAKKMASPLYKKLAALAKMAYLPHATPRELGIWVGKHFTKEKICAGDREIRHLLDRVGEDMMTLAGEIQKVCAYLHFHGKDTLTIADIDAVAAETRELKPFALSNAILAGRVDEALDILDIMRQKKQAPMLAFAGIYSTYIDLYRIRACLDDGMTVPDIAKKLKMNEYRAKIYAAAAKNTTSARLGDLLTILRDEDSKIKADGNDYSRLRTLVCRAAKG